MFYTIYKITNLIDGKIYIGKHQTKKIDDSYMGSGKLLRRAIAKHGINTFNKEILFCFDNESDMNAKEAELVTDEFCASENTYNLCVGGNGGFSYINREIWNSENNHIRLHNLSLMTDEQRILNGKKTGSMLAARWKNDPDTKPYTFTKEFNTEMAKRAQTEDVKIRRAETRKKNKFQVGENNSQYGTMWITNGQENKRIKKDIDIIPEGWHKGRK